MNELSADQILETFLIADRDIRSFQIENRTAIRPGQDYWWTERFWLLDGPDYYLRVTSGEDPDVFEEWLFYRGVPYRRMSAGAWQANLPDNLEARDQEASSNSTRSDRDYSRRAVLGYGIKFQFISDLKRLPDEMLKGSTVFRLHGQYKDWRLPSRRPHCGPMM